MTSDKKNVSLLADIFVKKGLSNIIISPGSRNAPLVLAFANNPNINALSIVDERSAGFYALGMAQQTRIAVAVACTSGSAALNYAPAIAEAYYQKIPLLVLTADRPAELIDQGDGQTIRQKDVYKNYIKASFELPVVLDGPATFRIAERIINSAIDQTQFPEPGPVHINIPFREPLYGATDENIIGKAYNTYSEAKPFSEEKLESMAAIWNSSKRIMLIAGQMPPGKLLNNRLSALAKLDNVVVLTETTSNLYGGQFVGCIDNMISSIKEEEKRKFKPELLISFGGQVVSKMLKKFLRLNAPKNHWHISESGEQPDTYFCLSDSASLKADEFFNFLAPKIEIVESAYSRIWHNRLDTIKNRRMEFLKNVEYSDLQVFDFLLREIPGGSILHLGNSTPVRYSQLFGSKSKFEYQSNRGVSGIDGQVSTAAGASLVTNKINTIVTGDLGFFYDSNALMYERLPSNLKIIVINNAGGGIFRFIPGPDQTPHLSQFFETEHQWKAKKIAEAFRLNYYSANNLDELSRVIQDFYSPDLEKAALLEIFTPSKINARVLRDYFKFLKI